MFHRRSIRLPGYDYATNGSYFVTICTHNRASLFGEISQDKMVLNQFGKHVDTIWHSLPMHHQYKIGHVPDHAKPHTWNYRDALRRGDPWVAL